MAEESNVEPEPDWSNRLSDAAEDTFVAMESLLTTLRALETDLRQRAVSETSSTEYCDNFCQALMHYAGSRNSVDHGLPLLEVYCLSINCFAAARPHLTADSDSVALVLKRLALSCFELLLSVTENEIPYVAWVQFHQSVQMSHDALLEYGSTDLQALLQITGEGGAWSNPVLTALLSGQHTSSEDVDAYIALEGEGFMEMRVKHLEKMGEVAKAVVLAKACTECCLISNQATFRQTYVTLLCQLLPNEEAIMEISRLNCKDVLDITCNLETEGDENTAFILCTTFLTRQLQQQNLYCSWELTLLWSKLQRRIDPSLESLLERCLQLGAIAKTVCHLLFLVRVIGAEAEQLGLAASVELCVKALQLPKQEEQDGETRISVCTTVSSLLPEDLEVRRACQLTQFLLGPSQAAFSLLQELHQRPDQKYDQENAIIPNSLRCELFLALKAHWPFDPEFWDWNMLRRHCVTLLGLDPEEEEEEEKEEEEEEEGGEEGGCSGQRRKEEGRGTPDFTREFFNGLNGSADSREEEGAEDRKSKFEKGDRKSNRWEKGSKCKEEPGDRKSANKFDKGPKCKKQKFSCQICKKSVTETRILHHSKRHVQNEVYTCPVCLATFPSRKLFIPHTKLHLTAPQAAAKKKKKKQRAELDELMDAEEDDDSDDLEPGEIALDPSLMLYYQTTHDPDVLDHILEQAKTAAIKPADEEHVTFNYIDVHFELRNRDVYPCPGAHCTKTFKHHKYLGVHLKSEHAGDQNVKHYFEMKARRVKCPFCRRHFMSAYHIRKHRRVHTGDRPYPCLVAGCSARFETSVELAAHKPSAHGGGGAHRGGVSYECELKGCAVAFGDLGQLYHHEAQHFYDAAYSCAGPDCKKFYLSKKEFVRHLATTHGVTFSEEDFEAQREAKRKRVDHDVEDGVGAKRKPGDTEEGVGPKKPSDAKSEAVDDDVSMSFSATTAASTSHLSRGEPPPPKGGTVTAVAVCFDGKKFTCGFERCGMSFSRARDVQRHLKAAHPEHLKSETKEHKKHDKERGPKTKSPVVKPDRGAKENGRNELPTTPQQSKGTSQDKTTPSQVNHNTAPLSSPVAVASSDSLRDILIGLSKLTLNGPSSSPSRLPSAPLAPSQASLRHALMIKSPVVLLQKGAQPLVGERVKVTAKTEPSKSPAATDTISPFLLQASTKPYACEVTGCGFRSVTSYTLMRHYIGKHRLSTDKAKSRLKAMTFRPFVCHICAKAYKEKSDLRAHYTQTHKLAETVVEQMSCAFKRSIDDLKEASESPRKIRISPSPSPNHHQNAPPLSKDSHLKGSKRDVSTWQRRYQWKKAVMLRRKNGLGKPAEKCRKTIRPPSSTREEPEEEWLGEGEAGEEEEGERNGKGSEDGASRETNGTSCLVAKRNLCYILTRYKSFQCKNKDCGAAFGSQGELLQHLQVMHRYNHSQLSLEKDPRHQKHDAVKKETAAARLRSSPPSDDPVPQFKCTFGNCKASYHLRSSLVRHAKSEHKGGQPGAGAGPGAGPAPAQPSYSYLDRRRASSPSPSSHARSAADLAKHVLYTRCAFYDSLVVHLQSTRAKDDDKSVSGCQKKLIITKTTTQKTTTKATEEEEEEAPSLQPPPPPTPPSRQSLRLVCKPGQNPGSEATDDDNNRAPAAEENVDDGSPLDSEDRQRFEDMIFRSNEEALQMCQDRCPRVAYPCMVYGCDSVVKFSSSMRRHYLKCHYMQLASLTANQEKLMLNAEQLEEIIQKRSALNARTPDATSATRAPNGVLKMEYQAEPESPGGPSLPMSLHSIKIERLDDDHDALGFAERPAAERNGLVGADDLLYGDPAPAAAAAQNGHTQENRTTRRQVSNPPLPPPPPSPRPPPTVDLSPPPTLRFSVDGGFLGTAGNKPTNAASSAPVPPPAPAATPTATPARQPLKRKNELSEPAPPPAPSPAPPKEPQPPVPPRGFNLAAYKPMGFESSFLKFIQETTQSDDGIARTAGAAGGGGAFAASRRRDFHRRSDCSVKENSRDGLALLPPPPHSARNRRTRSSPLKSSPATGGERAAAQNLRSILDKALAGCGDLAVKQLQYLRPVVVLERPRLSVSTPLIHLFPTDSNDKRILGS